MMKNKLLSKHQRLILQCYPAGRGSDKKPNASELSYLLYYVSTRKAKLTKVGNFLEKTAKSDVYRGKAGNVQVTLDIVNVLMEKCYDDLNLFARNVVEILTCVLSSNDLALCQHASNVFRTFCKYHDGALFAGDQEYVRSFLGLIQQYATIFTNARGTNSMQWKLLGIDAAKSVAISATLYSTVVGQSQISIFTPLLLSTIESDDLEGADIRKLKPIIDESVAQNRRTSVIKSEVVESPDNKKKREQLNLEEQIKLTALEALNRLFDTTSGAQIRYSTQALVKYILDHHGSNNWASALLEQAARWTPVQLRFVLLSSLVDIFSSHTLSNKISSQLTICFLITSLLSSSVNMVGLSVIDILRSLLLRQHQLIRAGQSSKSETNELICTIRKCISSITTHIYYGDQIADMVVEVLNRCHYSGNTREYLHNGSIGESSTHSNEVKRKDVVLNDLKNVKSILDNTNSGIASNKIPLIVWEGTQTALSSEPEIRLAYANAFITYLHVALNEDDKAIRIHKNFIVTRTTLGRIVQTLYNVAVDASCKKCDFIILHHLFTNIVNYLGINGAVRVVPFALMWHDVGVKVAQGMFAVKSLKFEQGLALIAISLSIIENLALQLELPDLAMSIKKDIGLLRSSHLWYPHLEIPLKRSLAEDIELKRSLEASYDEENVMNIKPLDREILTRQLVINDFPAELRHFLFEDASVFEESSNGTDTATDSLQTAELSIAKTRSLKQLRGNNLGLLPTASSYTALRNIMDSPTRNANESSGNSLYNMTLPRQDISSVPKVLDLKRVASGNLNGNGSIFSKKHGNRGGSISMRSAMSFDSSMDDHNDQAQGSLQSRVNEYNEKIDISAFLSNLSVNSVSDRGRLS